MEEINIRKLKSDNGKIFEIEEDCLLKYDFLKGLLEDFSDPKQELPIKEVNDRTLERVVAFLKHYQKEEVKKIPCPCPSTTVELKDGTTIHPVDLKAALCQWDYDFITPLSIEEAIELVNAANSLNIQPLIDLASARLAYDFTNCSIEDARKKFGIESDMTKEEQDEMDKYLKYLD